MDVRIAKDCSAKKPGIDLRQNMSPDSYPQALGTYPILLGQKSSRKAHFSKEWKEMNVVLVNPDYTQHKIRKSALVDVKMLIAASQNLR